MKTITSNKAGVPDLLVCFNGFFIGLEVKAGSSTTPLQLHNLEKIREAGGISAVVRSVEDAEKIIINCELLNNYNIN